MQNINLGDHLYDNHTSEDGLYRYWVGDYPLASLFRYRGLVRRLILDFKMLGRWRSGTTLIDMFAEDEFVQFWSHECDYIMAVPSSFWGRWRGKHDLAAALAEKLSQEIKVPLIHAPRRHFFRFQKQAFRSLRERLSTPAQKRLMHEQKGIIELRKGPKSDTSTKDFDKPLILLVDDIVTSARTLKSMADAIPNARFRFITLASAYKARTWEDQIL